MFSLKNFNIFAVLLVGLLLFMSVGCVCAVDSENSTVGNMGLSDTGHSNRHNENYEDLMDNIENSDAESLISSGNNEIMGSGNIYSDATFASLASAINSADPGSTIKLSNNFVWSNNDKSITINKALTIDGNGYEIDAKGKCGIFSITADNVFLKNMKIINGNFNEGGAIHLSASKCTLNNCTFENNTASSSGGAIFVENNMGNVLNTLTIDNCHFIANSAHLMGGSICSIWGSTKISNSTFVNDHSGYGGSILSLYNNLNVCSSVFYNDTACEYGGAIYKKSGNYNAPNGWIRYTSSSSLVNCVFDNNYAYYDGGAVYLSHDNLTMNNTLFSRNFANYGGGSLHMLLSHSIMDNVTFIGGFNGSNLNGVVDAKYINSFIDSGNDMHLFVTDTSDYNGTIPSYYNLKDKGYVTPSEDQKGGTCWAYAGISALESAILKASGGAYDFSENNMINVLGGYSDHGRVNRNPRSGGYNTYSIEYNANWLGYVEQGNDPAKSNYFSPVLKSGIHVQDMIFLPKLNADTADIYKECIMKYGAVSTSILMKTPSGYNYYTNETGDDHMINIIGWDDNYKADNFPGPGAWICKNSWGNDWGDNGCFYVSYYDKSLGNGYSTSGTTSYVIFFNGTMTYDRNYQYDYSSLTWKSKNVKKIFYKNCYSSVADENVCAFSTFFHEKTDWEVSIYVNNEFKHSQTGNSMSAGYFTFNLDKTIPVHKGDEISVILKCSNGKSTQYMPVCSKEYMATQSCGKGVSYWSTGNNKWNDFDNSKEVACLKLFTQKMPAEIDVSDALELTGGDDEGIYDILNPDEVGILIYVIPIDTVNGHKNHTNNDTPDNMDNNASDNKGNVSYIVKDNITMGKTGIPIYWVVFALLMMVVGALPNKRFKK